MIPDLLQRGVPKRLLALEVAHARHQPRLQPFSPSSISVVSASTGIVVREIVASHWRSIGVRSVNASSFAIKGLVAIPPPLVS
jgi:hypothetical protein